MPFWWKVPGLSNKQNGELNKRLGYRVQKGIYVLKPVIDTVNITFKIANEDHQVAVRKAIWDLAESGYQVPKKWGQKHLGYKASVELRLPLTDRRVLIQSWLPKTPASFRLEFSVNQLGHDGIGELAKLVDELGGGHFTFADVVNAGSFRRLDIAVDIIGCPFGNIVLAYSGSGKSHWYQSEQGAVETAYFGKKADENAPHYGYNKRVEQAEHGKPQLYNGLPHARIEHRLSPQNSPLATIDSPLETLVPSNPSSHPPDGYEAYLWALFLDSCRQKGEVAALQHLPTFQMKADFQLALSDAKERFWRPDKLWESWPNYLKNCGLPFI